MMRQQLVVLGFSVPDCSMGCDAPPVKNRCNGPQFAYRPMVVYVDHSVAESSMRHRQSAAETIQEDCRQSISFASVLGGADSQSHSPCKRTKAILVALLQQDSEMSSPRQQKQNDSTLQPLKLGSQSSRRKATISWLLTIMQTYGLHVPPLARRISTLLEAPTSNPLIVTSENRSTPSERPGSPFPSSVLFLGMGSFPIIPLSCNVRWWR